MLDLEKIALLFINVMILLSFPTKRLHASSYNPLFLFITHASFIKVIA